MGRVVRDAELVLLRRLPREPSREVPDRALVRRRAARQILLIGPHVRVAGVLVEERRDVVPGAGVANGAVEPDLVALDGAAEAGIDVENLLQRIRRAQSTIHQRLGEVVSRRRLVREREEGGPAEGIAAVARDDVDANAAFFLFRADAASVD